MLHSSSRESFVFAALSVILLGEALDNTVYGHPGNLVLYLVDRRQG